MLNWLKPRLRSSIYGSRAIPPAPSGSDLESVTEDIREAMLALLVETEPQRDAEVIRRIRLASDIEALWYLRGHLMVALAGMHGELAARGLLAPVSAQFQGRLRGGLQSRPSPLMN
jgi:hypothetical protein